MTPIVQPPLGSENIPVIDISALRDGSDPDRIAAALHRASAEHGFLYVSGHGIPTEIIDTARAAALRFFKSPTNAKAPVRVNRHHRGWLATGGATMRDGDLPDLKESFLWAADIDGDSASAGDHPLRGDNQWPQTTPHFREAAMAWFEAAQSLSMDLLRGFARGLGLAPGTFLSHCDNPLSRGSFVYYPPNGDADTEVERFGVGPHTDFGVLTVLCQDDVGGLQILNLDEQWIEAPPIPGTLLINVGDLLARWTEGAYRSTPHRVINRSGRERLSLVLAFDPDPETIVDARQVFGSDHNPAQAPITCGDYLNWRFEKAFAYRRERR